MLEITYDFELDGVLQADPFLDSYQISQMFEQTKLSLEKSLRRKLDGLTCPEHGESPRIAIVGRYNTEQEEFDIHYNIDTCCNLFLAQIIKVLNSVN